MDALLDGWVRTCQACGYKQSDTRPKTASLGDAYADRKCKRCKSSDLDYGRRQREDDCNICRPGKGHNDYRPDTTFDHKAELK